MPAQIPNSSRLAREVAKAEAKHFLAVVQDSDQSEKVHEHHRVRGLLLTLWRLLAALHGLAPFGRLN